MTELITRLGERMISALVPQEKAEAVGGCKVYSCYCPYHAAWGTYSYDTVHGTYCWSCRHS
ncbi:hypothetical protein [Nonomuraea sp. NPDC049784]|uniref:hypothetical protein n=1 Tax=Nonomuraea sp. NPDC049784 TaxID=3154361 RepID=UPI0033C2390E